VIVGLLFSLAVFLTYLLLGLGALTIVKEFSVNSGIAKGINLFMAGFCIVIGLVSFADVLKYKKTQKADFKLKLPKSLRKIINRQINTKMRKNHLWFWALFLGISVSLLESLCTGQVYLPTIAIMVKRGSTKAFGLLLLYNLMFIIPLLAIFAVTLAGASSKQITNFFMRNLLLSKILMTLLFLFLGIYLFVNTVH
jgi:sulfite exporter TauE/SafE